MRFPFHSQRATETAASSRDVVLQRRAEIWRRLLIEGQVVLDDGSDVSPETPGLEILRMASEGLLVSRLDKGKPGAGRVVYTLSERGLRLAEKSRPDLRAAC